MVPDVTEERVPDSEVTCKELAMEPFVNVGQEEDEKQLGQKKKEQKKCRKYSMTSTSHPMKQNEKKKNGLDR